MNKSGILAVVFARSGGQSGMHHKTAMNGIVRGAERTRCLKWIKKVRNINLLP